LAIASTTQTGVSLSWSASPSTGVVGYAVYVNGNAVASTAQTAYQVSSLACGTGYKFEIDAFDKTGNHSTRISRSSATSACSSSPPSIYWGAWIEGQDTYTYLYGGSWTNAPWDSATWNRFEANARKKVSIDHYGQPPPWEQAFNPGVGDIITGRGAIPLMDMSTKSVSLTSVASGAYDSSLTAWARAVKAWGKPFFLRWNWEMNGTWFPWGAQAAQNPSAFVAAWRHFHDVVDREGASNVTWVWCPNLEFSSSTPYEQLYPGDAYVDWTCLDGYNKGSSSESFASLYRASYNHLLTLAPSKPIMIGEIASEEYGPGAKAAWITDALAVQLPTSFPQVKAFVWFNWRIQEGGRAWNWEIESSAATQQAFATAIAAPYYAPGGSFGNLPALTKIKPLG
jgi:hypothetical protein